MMRRILLYAAALFLLYPLRPIAAQEKSSKSKKPTPSLSSKSEFKEPRKLTLAQLPSDVRDAFESAYSSDAFVSARSVQRNGQTFFKVTAQIGSRSRDLLYTEKGELVEFTETLSPVELPELVKEAVQNEYRDVAVLSAKRIVSAAPTLYEVSIRRGEEKDVIIYDTRGNVVRKLESLPSAVEKAFAAAYPNAEILAFKRYESDGVARWVIESKDGATFRELIYADSGELIGLTESLSPLELPEAIKETLADSFAGASVTSARRVVSIEYRVGVEDSTGATALALDASGKLLHLHEDSAPHLADATAPLRNARPEQERKPSGTSDSELQPIRSSLPIIQPDSLTALRPLPDVATTSTVKEAKDEKQKRIVIIRRYYAPSLSWIPPVVRIWRPRWLWW